MILRFGQQDVASSTVPVCYDRRARSALLSRYGRLKFVTQHLDFWPPDKTPSFRRENDALWCFALHTGKRRTYRLWCVMIEDRARPYIEIRSIEVCNTTCRFLASLPNTVNRVSLPHRFAFRWSLSALLSSRPFS